MYNFFPPGLLTNIIAGWITWLVGLISTYTTPLPSSSCQIAVISTGISTSWFVWRFSWGQLQICL